LKERVFDLPRHPTDRERIDRILGKLGLLWRRVPEWSLAWLVVNLAPPGPEASDAQIEVELDRLIED
jgi:hypothetical protein